MELESAGRDEGPETGAEEKVECGWEETRDEEAGLAERGGAVEAGPALTLA